MANKSLQEKVEQSTLQRGKACLRCRKRKMRCDGAKPACQQCSRAKKADACEYDNGKGKTRTQLLKEEVKRLQERVRELEGVDQNPSSVILHDPHDVRPVSTSPFYDSSASSSTSPSPFLSDATDSSFDLWPGLPITPSPCPSPYAQSPYFLRTNDVPVQPDHELAQFFLATFAPHKNQSGLMISIDRVREWLLTGTDTQPHSALLNAIYLWACYVSRPGPFSQHEDHYLGQTLESIRRGLRAGGDVLAIIQASCLVSTYFLANGRLLEGSYHASAAAALAVQHRLHEYPTNSKDAFAFELKKGVPPSQRILTFWQVYNLDLCWSVVLRKPSILPDRHSIACPWPLAEYDLDVMQESPGYRTVGPFLDGELYPAAFSPQAIRTKATAIFAHADQIHMSWSNSNVNPKQLNGFRADVQTLEHTIGQFLSTLVPVAQLGATQPEERHAYIAAHTLAHTSILRLYGRFAHEDSVASIKCSHAAKACANIVRLISPQDLLYLDPIVVAAWSYASDTLIRELNTVEKSWPLMDDPSMLREDIFTLFYALRDVSAQFPIAGMTISKIRARMGEIA